MAKSIEVQHQIKAQCEGLRNDLASMKNWEKEMREKEKNKSTDHIILQKDQPPVRSQLDKMEEYEKSVNCTKTEEASADNKLNELKIEADVLKESGNDFVKKQNYQEAIDMYTKAIQLYNREASYFANRSLCYLKYNKYAECIQDCSCAIDLDETYWKAYSRRMQAYESLGHFILAFRDCQRVLELSSDKNKHNWHEHYDRLHNKIMEEEKKKELQRIKFSRMSKTAKTTYFIDKSPNTRSKKPLRKLTVNEKKKSEKFPEAIIDKIFNNATGENHPEPEITSPYKCTNVLFKSRSVEEKLSHSLKKPEEQKTAKTDESLKIGENPKILDAVKEQEKELKKVGLIRKTNENLNASDSKAKETAEKTQAVVVNGSNEAEGQNLISKTLEEMEKLHINELPKTGPQFYAAWKELTEEQRFLYLKEMAVQYQPVGQILGSTLDSDLLSEILQIIHKYFLHFKIAITKLLLELGKNIEMSILAMFLLNNDKILLTQIMCHIQANENPSEDDLAAIRKRFLLIEV